MNKMIKLLSKKEKNEDGIFHAHTQVCRLMIGHATCLSYQYTIMTYGSESRGQESAKRSPKTKHMTNYWVSFTRANVFVI